MATDFPESLDALTNPQSTDSVQTVSHAAQHANANDAIEALQLKVGVDDSLDTSSLDYRVNTLENASVDTEAIQDIAGGMFQGSTNSGITVEYDDATGKINLTTLYSNADAINAVATALSVTTGLTKTYDAGLNTITLSVDASVFSTKTYVDTSISNLIDSSPALLNTLNEIAAAINDDANFATTVSNAIASAITTANEYADEAVASLGNTLPDTYVQTADVGNPDGVASLDANGFIPNIQLNIDERIQDVASTMITSATHSGVSVEYDDNTGRLSFTGVPLTQEQVQDFIAPLLNHSLHTNITSTYDDANNKIILEASGGGGSAGTGGSLTNSWWLGA